MTGSLTLPGERGREGRQRSRGGKLSQVLENAAECAQGMDDTCSHSVGPKALLPENLKKSRQEHPNTVLRHIYQPKPQAVGRGK